MKPAAGEGDAAWPADAVEVGVVLGAWGVRGGFKVRPYADDPQALFSSKRWHLLLRDGVVERPLVLRVSQAREQGDAIVVTAHDLDDRDSAEALRGARVFIARSSFPSTPDDEYYWVDLVGLNVVNREGVGLGVVRDLIDTGVHSVLCVRQGETPAPSAEVEPDDRAAASTRASSAAEATERLIPFVAAYVDQVDLAARRIVVDWQPDY